ncbi:MAG: McrC family protein [Firmicutes bacterium]|nr:McrC family protein [Bacillota bacterium]
MENVNIKHFSIKEQDTFKSEERAILKELNLDFSDKNLRYLGLNPYNFSVSYYIGIDWLKEKENYIAVEPKIMNLDYVKMFVHCLHHSEISKSLKEIYHIDFQKSQIEVPAANWDLTPFLIVHFLSLVEKIVKQGLKSNYIVREENLKSKIKGKILLSQQVKKNIVARRKDRVFCRFQEYSINCLENRLLKKALLFIQRYSKCYSKKYPILIQKQNRLLCAFENISDDISYSEIKQIKINTLYKEYLEAVELAKKILQYFGYSYKKTEITDEKKMPPFWIDMSKLFELYIYSLLKDAYSKEILYQPRGKHGNVDFLKKDEKIIIDTKYKDCYANGRYEIEDIRQLSGYARDWGVLQKLCISSNNEVVDCVIIYPDNKSESDFKKRKLKETEIEQFTKFYKCGIRLPLKE